MTCRPIALLLLAFGIAAATEAEERKPNVILILADDLGIEGLGCYGGLSYRTPHLDKLATQGIRFRHAYSQPLCTNTRIQLMTGKYNHRNWLSFGILDPRERTIGHYMQEAGYKTCIAGKWQLQSYDPPDYPSGTGRRGTGMHPKNAGFDEYSLWHTGHTEDKGSRYADPRIFENGAVRGDTKGRYGPDISVEFIERFLRDNRERPFFVYYSMALPHGPFEPTPKSPEWQNEEQRRVADPRYFKDMVEYMDHCIGRIVDAVDGLGLADDTVILFTSDNGTPQQIATRWKRGVLRGGKGLTTGRRDARSAHCEMARESRVRNRCR